MNILNYFLKRQRAKNDSDIKDGTEPMVRRNAGQISKNDISSYLAGKILKGQQSIATFLNRKTKGISKVKMRLLVISFLMMGVAYCLYLVLSAVLVFL